MHMLCSISYKLCCITYSFHNHKETIKWNNCLSQWGQTIWNWNSIWIRRQEYIWSGRKTDVWLFLIFMNMRNKNAFSAEMIFIWHFMLGFYFNRNSSKNHTKAGQRFDKRLWGKFRNCYWVRFLLLQFGFSYESDIKRFVRLLPRVRGSKPIEFVHWLLFMSAND